MNTVHNNGLVGVRVPPQAVEAEASIIGALLLDNAAFDHITDLESRGNISHGFVMTTCDVSTCHQIWRPPGRDTWLSWGNAHSHCAHIGFAFTNLHRQISNVGSLFDPRHAGDAAVEIIVDT